MGLLYSLYTVNYLDVTTCEYDEFPMILNIPPTPIDIIGDIHGELGALNALLFHLGYDVTGRHPEGRKLVFVGDLCDRGPDSPGVISLVRSMVEDGTAYAIMGNHELNLLRGERKDGNNWFWGNDNPEEDKFEPYVRIKAADRNSLLKFMEELPLVIQREDLRIVHAAWDDNALAQLSDRANKPVISLFDQWEARIANSLADEGLLAESDTEIARWASTLNDPDQTIPLLRATGLCDERRQMENPVKVLVSGMERLACEPFYSSGKWRFSNRLKWWEEYHEEVPVVVGHYWRQFGPIERKQFGKGGSYLFDGIDPTHWHGALGNVFCVDFSVGGRYQERRAGTSTNHVTKLAALRWPERTLVLDSGAFLPTERYRRPISL